MAIESDDPTDVERKRSKAIQLSPTAADNFDSVHLATSLPTELITEILIKLPVKFILQFRCVSGYWRALISDPIFVKKHLRASTKEDDDYAHHRLITNSIGADVESCSLLSFLHEEFPIDTHALDYPMKRPFRTVCLVGSLNGLVCISIDEYSVFLWNPSTRMSKRLPHCGITRRPCQQIKYGFGYDEDSSEYKVVAIHTETILEDSSFETEVKIYGLKSDSWRTVEDFPNCRPISTSGMFASGSLHWDSDIQTDFNDYQSIISFDLSKETYSEISQPCSGQQEVSYSIIGVLNGCLSLLRNFGGRKVDIWVMKEHGKIESWSKLFSLHSQHGPMYSYCSTPLYISKKNEVFLVFGPHLAVYNVESKTARHSIIDKFSHVIDAVTYKESLVTPFPERCAQTTDQRSKFCSQSSLHSSMKRTSEDDDYHEN